MNKRNKIIVSIVGITIVALALLGITYAYYLTRIQGNTNTNSISITTAKLELVYDDNHEEIIEGNGALVPKLSTEISDAIGTKTFTVTNNGTDSSYVVIIDNVNITNASDGSETTFLSNDFRYTLTCTKSDNSKCNEVNDLTLFPINGGILLGNDIAEGDVHTYTLTLWYIDTGVDQSDDMGKSYQARVNIDDISNINPYEDNKNSLAYKIIDNSKNKTNGTELVVTPRTTITENADAGVQLKYIQDDYRSTTFPSGITYYYENMEFDENTGVSILSNRKEATSNEDYVGNYVDYCSCNNQDPCNCADSFYVESVEESTFTTISLWPELVSYEELDNNEKELSIAQDDFGISYYYRGRVLDNYVNYANKCWRIVRILGNGSIKLVLEDNTAECNSENYIGEYSIGISTTGYVYNDRIGQDVLSYMALTSTNTTNTATQIYKNYQTNAENFSSSGIENYIGVLTTEGWCVEDAPYTYGEEKIEELSDEKFEEWVSSETYEGVFNPYISYSSNIRREKHLYTFKCEGNYITKYDSTTDMLVGALTMDETIYSGISLPGDYTNSKPNNTSYLISKIGSTWGNPTDWIMDFNTMNVGNEGNMKGVYVGSNIDGVYVYDHSGGGGNPTRPAVIVKSGINVTGTGTKSDPYVINVE